MGIYKEWGHWHQQIVALFKCLFASTSESLKIRAIKLVQFVREYLCTYWRVVQCVVGRLSVLRRPLCISQGTGSSYLRRCRASTRGRSDTRWTSSQKLVWTPQTAALCPSVTTSVYAVKLTDEYKVLLNSLTPSIPHTGAGYNHTK